MLISNRRPDPHETSDPAGPRPVVMIRERNKTAKREAIKLAARGLFSEQGFERTTLRQIADRAAVGLGTIMLYADDKKDLVLLMYNAEIEALIAEGVGRIVLDADVSQNVVRFSEVFYRAFAANLELARTYLQHNFYTDGTNTLGLHQNRRRKLEALRTVLELGQQRGRVRLDTSVETMANAFLLLYRASVRSWIAEPRPDPEEGLASLRELIELQYQGVCRRD